MFQKWGGVLIWVIYCLCNTLRIFVVFLVSMNDNIFTLLILTFDFFFKLTLWISISIAVAFWLHSKCKKSYYTYNHFVFGFFEVDIIVEFQQTIKQTILCMISLTSNSYLRTDVDSIIHDIIDIDTIVVIQPMSIFVCVFDIKPILGSMSTSSLLYGIVNINFIFIRVPVCHSSDLIL